MGHKQILCTGNGIYVLGLRLLRTKIKEWEVIIFVLKENKSKMTGKVEAATLSSEPSSRRAQVFVLSRRCCFLLLLRGRSLYII